MPLKFRRMVPFILLTNTHSTNIRLTLHSFSKFAAGIMGKAIGKSQPMNRIRRKLPVHCRPGLQPHCQMLFLQGAATGDECELNKKVQNIFFHGLSQMHWFIRREIIGNP